MNNMDIVAGEPWLRQFNFTDNTGCSDAVGGPSWGAELVLTDPQNPASVYSVLSIANGRAEWANVGQLWVKLSAEDTAVLSFKAAKWTLYLIGPDKCKIPVSVGTLEGVGGSCGGTCQAEQPQLISLKQGTYFGYSGQLSDKGATTSNFTGWNVQWQIRTCLNSLVFDSGKVAVTAAGVFAIGAPTNTWPVGIHKTDLVVIDPDGHPAHTQTLFVEITEAVTVL